LNSAFVGVTGVLISP